MKKQTKQLLLFISLILFTCTGVSHAVDYTVKTVPNVRLTDGNNYVSNPDGIISSSDVKIINEQLKKLEEEKSIEVAVVALNNIGYKDAKEFATELFNHWGIGKKEDDNGLLIFLITQASQRSVIFEPGYGLEGILPDALCYRMQQEHMIPDLKEGNYSAGMRKGVEAVVNYLMGSDYEAAVALTASQKPAEKNETLQILGTLLLIFGMFFGFIYLILTKGKYRKRVCPACAQKTYKYKGPKTILRASYEADGLLHEIYLCKSCGHTDTIPLVIPRLVRTRTRSTYSSTSRTYRSRPSSSSYKSSSRSSSGRSSSGSRSSSSRSSGRSYGGGRSGGGGARSRF